MPRSSAIARLGGRVFAPRPVVDALTDQVASISEANHRLRAEVERLTAEHTALTARLAEVESLQADQTEQLRRAVEDLLDRVSTRPA